MSILVNIENYEAFYLDYLEGNLDEEQMRAFLQFLDQNPELKMEEDLPSFKEDSAAQLDAGFIAGLKVFDAAEGITETNYEQFMIASVEGALPATKQVELNDFIARRPHLKPELDLYAKTRLVADTSIVYPNKAALKRGTVIPMYVRIAAVAASILLVLTFIPWNTDPESVMSAQVASLSVDLDIQAKENTRKIPSEIQRKTKPSHFAGLQAEEHGTQTSAANGREKNTVAVLQAKKATRIETVPGEKELVALNLKPENHVEADESESGYYLGLSEMKNPIPFVTNGIKNRFKQDVDLRTAKASKHKQGGFYLKIGKFEFSRKTAPVNEDVLAVNP
ncbi:MAG: hypothetical protein K0R65_2429 [Crocinitomicaceae bacterium]|jgi:hypothetical protein|nr:hypothetical protein [Crocinitomicaceae bacterium]